MEHGTTWSLHFLLLVPPPLTNSLVRNRRPRRHGLKRVNVNSAVLNNSEAFWFCKM